MWGFLLFFMTVDFIICVCAISKRRLTLSFFSDPIQPPRGGFVSRYIFFAILLYKRYRYWFVRIIGFSYIIKYQYIFDKLDVCKSDFNEIYFVSVNDNQKLFWCIQLIWNLKTRLFDRITAIFRISRNNNAFTF